MKIDGMFGVIGYVFSMSFGCSWQVFEILVGINLKMQEVVYCMVGCGGIVVVGEGVCGRFICFVNEECSKVQCVVYGVFVMVFYVGYGEDEVVIVDFVKIIKKFLKVIDKVMMVVVICCIDLVFQLLLLLFILKGIDFMKVCFQ